MGAPHCGCRSAWGGAALDLEPLLLSRPAAPGPHPEGTPGLQEGAARAQPPTRLPRAPASPPCVCPRDAPHSPNAPGAPAGAAPEPVDGDPGGQRALAPAAGQASGARAPPPAPRCSGQALCLQRAAAARTLLCSGLTSGWIFQQLRLRTPTPAPPSRSLTQPPGPLRPGQRLPEAPSQETSHGGFSPQTVRARSRWPAARPLPAGGKARPGQMP